MKVKWTTFFVVLIFSIQLASCINTIPDYFMQSGALGDCGVTISGKDDAYVRSHVGAYQLGSMINYGADEDCELKFDAGTGNSVLVKFLEFELENMVNGVCVDVLNIYDNSSVLVQDNSVVQNNCTVANNASISDNSTLSNNSCSDPGDPVMILSPTRTVCGSSAQTAFVSDGPEARFKFLTNSQNHFSGFKLLVAAFRENVTCTSDEFKCDTNRCFSKDLKCDTVEHCVDGTDEDDTIAGCTVLDKILGYVFGLGDMTVIVIGVLAGVTIFAIVTSIILYHVICKKKPNAVQPLEVTKRHRRTTSKDRGKKSKKSGKVESLNESPPSKQAWDKKPKKKKKKTVGEVKELW